MRLKQLREERGLSQYRLAKLSGVTQAYISRIEVRDNKSAGGVILQKLATALGCRIEDLLDEQEAG